MKITTLYLDSSVLGGYYDEEFLEATRTLWSQMKQGRFHFVSSLLVDQEISAAPERVQSLMAETFTQADLLPYTAEAEELAAAYLAQKVVPAKFADDARHVAIAVVNAVNIIASWNFKHLVNLQREAGFNAVNLLQGWPTVRIVSPLELIYDDEE